MKIDRNLVKMFTGAGLFIYGFNLMIDGIADANRTVGYHFGRCEGFSEGCKYARRRGINENNNGNNNSENKD